MPFQAPASDLSTGGGGFAAPDDEIVNEKSLSGFGTNLVNDAKDNVKGLWNLAGNFVEHPVDTAVDTIKHTPEALINEGKRLGIGELVTGHPINAIEKFGDAVYDKPLTTGMEVIPAAAGIAKGFGAASEAARGTEIAADAAKAARAGTATSAAEDAARVGVAGGAAAPAVGEAGASAPAVAAPAAAEDAVGNLIKRGSGMVDDAAGKMDEVKNYLGKKYGQIAEKPGWSDTVADYLDKFARNESVKNIGGSVGQIRQLGAEKAQALGKLAIDKGFTDPFIGDIGLGNKLKEFAKDAGDRIGKFREMADQLRNPENHPIDVLQEVRARLDPKYASGRGVHSGELSAYQKALQEIEDAEASHQAFADVSTKLNRYATDAKKMNQAPGPYSDVANVLSDVNNQHIADVLGPEKAAQYEQALKDFGAAKTMEKMHAFKEAREVGGRMGPGGAIRHMTQRFMDAVGYKYGAKVADRMAQAIRKNPGITKDLPSMFKELHNHIGDVSDEMPAQFAEGGIVGEVHQYLSDKYDKRR